MPFHWNCFSVSVSKDVAYTLKRSQSYRKNALSDKNLQLDDIDGSKGEDERQLEDLMRRTEEGRRSLPIISRRRNAPRGAKGNKNKIFSDDEDYTASASRRRQQTRWTANAATKTNAAKKDDNVSDTNTVSNNNMSPFSTDTDDATPNQSQQTPRSKGHGLRMATVIMPTKKEVQITVPSPRRCECSHLSKTELIPLTRSGKMSSREYQIVKEQMNSTIMRHSNIHFSKYKIDKVFKIKNCCLYNRYRNTQKELAKHGPVTERMFFHGTPSFRDIIANGFDERHSTIDGMFGAGIYFAEHSSKSNQYVFSAVKSSRLFAFLPSLNNKGCVQHKDQSCYKCQRVMLLCRVSLGRMSTRTLRDKMPHAPPGFNSVVGEPSPGGLQYPEYIIYKGEQAYPEYSITYRLVK